MYDKRLKKQREMRKKHMLTGGQAKLAAKAPPPNKIDAKDFAVLRAEKAKGRGMGLQDEKVKPGKVQKANLGLMFMKKAKDKGAKGAEFLSPLAMLKRLSGKKMGGVAKYKRGMGPGGLDLPVISSVKPAVHKTKKAQKTAVMKEQFNKQKSRTLDYAKKKGLPKPISLVAKGVQAMPLPGRLKLLKSLGKLPFVKGIGKKDVKKKMGGGMMQKPMGYKEGRSISTRGGGVDSSIIGRLRDAGPFKRIPLGKSRLTDEDRKKIRDLMQKGSSRKKALDTAKRVAKTVASAASPLVGAASAALKLAKKRKTTDRFTERDIETARSAVGMGSKNRPIKKDHSSRNPNPKTPKMMGGGMMMQRPMGYRSGTMVKARGCKLGRTRPTKIT